MRFKTPVTKYQVVIRSLKWQMFIDNVIQTVNNGFPALPEVHI